MKNVEEVKLISFNKPTGIGDWHSIKTVKHASNFDSYIMKLIKKKKQYREDHKIFKFVLTGRW